MRAVLALSRKFLYPKESPALPNFSCEPTPASFSTTFKYERHHTASSSEPQNITLQGLIYMNSWNLSLSLYHLKTPNGRRRTRTRRLSHTEHDIQKLNVRHIVILTFLSIYLRVLIRWAFIRRHRRSRYHYSSAKVCRRKRKIKTIHNSLILNMVCVLSVHWQGSVTAYSTTERPSGLGQAKNMTHWLSRPILNMALDRAFSQLT